MEQLTYDETTTSGKANILLLYAFNKVSLSKEIGISRPTLDTRLDKNNWKKSEIEMVNKIYKRDKDESPQR